MSTKKTFELAAEEIKFQLVALHGEERVLVKAALVGAFITIFRSENPRFDADRFREACEGEFSPTRFKKLGGR